jgi:stress-induced morphogen
MAGVSETIERKLRERFEPIHLEVINESGNHSVPRGSETHFRVVVVSKSFDGLGRVDRHKLVYGALAAELAGGVHALAVVSRTPDEWQKDAAVPASPPCLGGSKGESR